MKKILVIGLAGGCITTGIIYLINSLQKKHGQFIQLDFAENALGGY